MNFMTPEQITNAQELMNIVKAHRAEAIKRTTGTVTEPNVEVEPENRPSLNEPEASREDTTASCLDEFFPAPLVAAPTAAPTVTETMPFFQSIALPLAARGLKVMPVRGKRAFLESHPKEATSDASKITVDWAQYADCNVAVHCLQEEGGTLIVDCDDFDPVAEYKKETGKDAPITYTVQSTPPTDGKIGKTHQYFRQTARTIALPKNITEDATGGRFSLRLKNFYAVAEGSIHPVHKGRYTASNVAPVVSMPDDYLDWLLSKVGNSKPDSGHATDGKSYQPPAPGERITKCRNNACHAYAFHRWVTDCVTPERLAQDVHEFNRAFCDPPLDESELDSTVIPSVQKFKQDWPILIGGVPVGSAPSTPAAPAAPDVASTWHQNFKSVQELEEGDVRMLINGFLPEGVTFIGALPGEGKTLLGLSIAKALTTGEDFLSRLDFSVPEKVPVIYLIPESGGRAFRKRCEKFHIPNDRNLFICRTVSEGATISLDDPILLEAVQRMKPVVILDTLIRFSNSKDENSSMENKQLTEGMTRLRQAGAIGVIALHHSTKTMRTAGMSLETVLRGTGDIAAFPDAVYGMLRDNSLYDHGNGPNEIDVECVKPRDFDPPLPFRIAASRKTASRAIGQAPGIESVIDTLGDFLIVNKAAIQTNRDAELVRMVKGDPSISLKELSEATSQTTWIIRQSLKRLGWVKKPGGSKGAHQWAEKAKSGFEPAGETLKEKTGAGAMLQ